MRIAPPSATSPKTKAPSTTGGTPRCFSPNTVSARFSSSSAVPTAISIEFSSRVAVASTGWKKKRLNATPTSASVAAAAGSAT